VSLNGKHLLLEIITRASIRLFGRLPQNAYLRSGAKTIEIATYTAASIFNKSYASILLMMHVLNVTECGCNMRAA